MRVTPDEIVAGYTLGLPAAGLGAFSLENIALGADCRIPFLGELPIVGSYLFNSKRATEDEIELLIVVTPELVRAIDADQHLTARQRQAMLEVYAAFTGRRRARHKR